MLLGLTPVSLMLRYERETKFRKLIAFDKSKVLKNLSVKGFIVDC
jgi:hypothetical protein